MKLALRLSVLALRDLDRLPDFLELNSPRAAARVRDLLTTAISALADFPERGRGSPHASFRELPVRFGRAGYVIRYRVGRSEILVTRIFHTRERR